MAHITELTPEQLQRYWERVEVRGPDECWLWTGSLMSKGYGSVSLYDTPFTSHRVGYYIATGVDPIGNCVLHSCDNRKCCNPKHFVLGTHDDNNKDRAAKGRSADSRGEKHNQAILKEKDIKQIRLWSALGISCAELGRRYGVHAETIRSVITRQSWSHVT